MFLDAADAWKIGFALVGVAAFWLAGHLFGVPEWVFYPLALGGFVLFFAAVHLLMPRIEKSIAGRLEVYVKTRGVSLYGWKKEHEYDDLRGYAFANVQITNRTDKPLSLEFVLVLRLRRPTILGTSLLKLNFDEVRLEPRLVKRLQASELPADVDGRTTWKGELVCPILDHQWRIAGEIENIDGDAEHDLVITDLITEKEKTVPMRVYCGLWEDSPLEPTS